MTGFEPRNSCFRKQPLYRLGSGKLLAWSISIFDQMNYLPPFYLTSQLFIAEMVCSLIQKYLTISLSLSLSPSLSLSLSLSLFFPVLSRKQKKSFPFNRMKSIWKKNSKLIFIISRYHFLAPAQTGIVPLVPHA